MTYHLLGVKVPLQDWRRYQTAAQADGRTVSSWVRWVCGRELEHLRMSANGRDPARKRPGKRRNQPDAAVAKIGHGA